MSNKYGRKYEKKYGKKYDKKPINFVLIAV